MQTAMDEHQLQAALDQVQSDLVGLISDEVAALRRELAEVEVRLQERLAAIALTIDEALKDDEDEQAESDNGKAQGKGA